MRALLVALLVAMPPGVHYEGVQGTGMVACSNCIPPISFDSTASVDYELADSNTSIARTISTSGTDRLIVVMLSISGDNAAKTGITVSGSTLGTFSAAAQATHATHWVTGSSTAGSGTTILYQSYAQTAKNTIRSTSTVSAGSNSVSTVNASGAWSIAALEVLQAI